MNSFSCVLMGNESLLIQCAERVLDGGAEPGTVEIVDVEEVPLAYLPGNATRIRVKAVGTLAVE